MVKCKLYAEKHPNFSHTNIFYVGQSLAKVGRCGHCQKFFSFKRVNEAADKEIVKGRESYKCHHCNKRLCDKNEKQCQDT